MHRCRQQQGDVETEGAGAGRVDGGGDAAVRLEVPAYTRGEREGAGRVDGGGDAAVGLEVPTRKRKHEGREEREGGGSGRGRGERGCWTGGACAHRGAGEREGGRGIR